jgi:hypothetical protein
LLQRHYAGRRGRACATCGLSDLSICEHKHFTARCPLPHAAPQWQQQHTGHYYGCCIAVLRAERARPLAQGEASELLVECWDRLQAIEQAEYSGACWGVIAAPASSPRRRFVIRLSCLPERFNLHPPLPRLASNATHTPSNLGRIRACIYHAALHDRSDCCALHCTAATALAPPCARSQLSPTRVRRRRQQREAQTACVCPRASFDLTLAATAPGRVQRHWRVISATQGTARNRYPKAIVRHREPGKGATGWDAGSLVCNNLHVQWILVQSTQQH